MLRPSPPTSGNCRHWPSRARVAASHRHNTSHLPAAVVAPARIEHPRAGYNRPGGCQLLRASAEVMVGRPRHSPHLARRSRAAPANRQLLPPAALRREARRMPPRRVPARQAVGVAPRHRRPGRRQEVPRCLARRSGYPRALLLKRAQRVRHPHRRLVPVRRLADQPRGGVLQDRPRAAGRLRAPARWVRGDSQADSYPREPAGRRTTMSPILVPGHANRDGDRPSRWRVRGT